ncbi:MAG: hypothetical protein AAF446_07855 [Pseudomonadota bacterium]
MNFWTAAVAIMAIIGVVEIAKQWIKSRNKNQIQDRARAESAQLEELKARIQTLETIVTDKRETLKREIDEI